jgi:hypothetical protein
MKERAKFEDRHRREDIVKMDFKEIGWEGVEWIDLAMDGDQWRSLTNTLMNA